MENGGELARGEKRPFSPIYLLGAVKWLFESLVRSQFSSRSYLLRGLVDLASCLGAD